MTRLQHALADLCRRGLLTCTRGQPGADGATYALAWLPLDRRDDFAPEVRAQHDENQRALGVSGRRLDG